MTGEGEMGEESKGGRAYELGYRGITLTLEWGRAQACRRAGTTMVYGKQINGTKRTVKCMWRGGEQGVQGSAREWDPLRTQGKGEGGRGKQMASSTRWGEVRREPTGRWHKV